MQQELDELRADVAALRAELHEATSTPPSVMTRRRLLTGLAGLGAAGVATVASAPTAAADDGDNLVLGQTNTASSLTELHVARDQAIQPDVALRVILEDPDEPLDRDVHSPAAVQAVSLFSAVSGYGLFTGLEGFTDTGVAVVAQAREDGGTAFWGDSVRGPTAYLQSSDGVTLRLSPSADPGPPATTFSYEAGCLSVDGDGQPWLCVADGSPGTWTRLLREDTTVGRVIPITPIRVLDTRATGGRATGAPVVPGQRKGPIHGGQAITLDLAGVGPIPPDASGVIGNATVLTPSAGGFLRVLPAGASVPAASFNFQKGVTVANGFTCALTSAGVRATAPISSTIIYQLVIDIAAYIT